MIEKDLKKEESRKKDPRKKAHLQLNLMLLITVIPIVAAYVAYYTGWGVPTGTVNEGYLLTPAKNIRAWLSGASGDIPSIDNNTYWRLFIPVRDCEKECEDLLYLTRQVHIRLAQRADRIERYMVNLNDVQGDTLYNKLYPAHPKMKKVTVDFKQWQDWLEGTNAPDVREKPFYLLVDQVGFAMMFYTDAQEGNELLKDIKRVLKYSPD